MAKKRLQVVANEKAGLGRPTIMDRTLAARYGAPYVHLAAFAIDVERAMEATSEYAPLPFGWEVRLTEAYLLSILGDEALAGEESLLEDVCLGILESKQKPPPLGALITFAVYAALSRGLLDEALRPVFDEWPAPPDEMARDVAQMAQDETLVPKLARHCLDLELEPPLVAPVREALETMAG